MIGKIVGIGILLTALMAGGALYYLQVYHFYEIVEPDGSGDVVMTNLVSGRSEPVQYDSFKAIDAESSPIRFRACFRTNMTHAMLSETYATYEKAEPRVAPGWFECFEADTIGAALEDGTALAFLGQRDIQYGIDRVVAVHEDGRGYIWHQINRCGEVLFDGEPLPADCPAPPKGN